MKTKITMCVLFAALLGLVGCKTTEEEEREQQRDMLKKILLFNKIDTSKDEYITIAEFRAAMTGRSRKDSTLMFMQYDQDGNGVLTMTEWRLID